MASEYVNDVPYVRQFVDDLSPARLRLVAALHGVEPPPGDDLDYCELGCAHGDTLAALAAAYPQGRFLGIDLSGAHIASAKRLARDGALENIGFLERDFADLVHEDIGPFDYVVAHGVLSWVSPDKRRALIDFARAKLRPGGLLFVSYNAMPGWASIEPLRQLLLFPSVGAGPEVDTLERARRGLDFATAMQQAGAEYFVKNPAAAEMLQKLTRAGLPYLVHEYMHEHWSPMYFARVAWEMTEGDLHYVGSLPLYTNFRDTAVAEPLERLLRTATDRVTFESLKDLALDQSFRRDVFVKGAAPRSVASTSTYLETTAFGMLAPPREKKVQLPYRTVDIGAPTFEALLAAFGQGADTLEELAARAEMPVAMTKDELRAALTRLLVIECATPMRAPTRTHALGADGAFSVPSPYNQMMLRRISSDVPLVLASIGAGTAFPISALDALALRAITEARGPEREKWVRDFVGRGVIRLRIGDRVVEDPAEQIKTILGTVDEICSQRLAKLVELGVLAPSH